MDDLISRQWLMNCVNEGWIKFDTEKDKNRFIHLVRDIAPSAESELIRCQDCKFGLGHAHNVKCDKYYGMGGYDGFWSRAERKEDATE